MRTRNGFTLIEMLVVITMIGLLMAMITGALHQARRAAQRARAQTQLRDLIAAWGTYYMTEKHFNQGVPPLWPPDGELEDGWVIMTRRALEPLVEPKDQGFVYLNLSDAQFKKIGGTQYYADPWRVPYQVRLNEATENMAPPDLVIKASVSFINRTRE